MARFIKVRSQKSKVRSLLLLGVLVVHCFVRADDASTLLSAPQLPAYQWFASTDPKRQNADYILLQPGETKRVSLSAGVLLRLWNTAFEPEKITLVLQNGKVRTEILSGGKAKFGELYQKAFTFYPTQSTPASARELKSGAVLIATNNSQAENKWFYQAAVRPGANSLPENSVGSQRAVINEAKVNWDSLDAALKTPALEAKKLLALPKNNSGFQLHIASGSARSQKGQPISILKVQGKGAFVGLVLDIRPAPDAVRRTFAFLEGNEILIADGKKYEGTGTEDFFNSAWYYPEKPFSKQYHGVSFKSNSPPRVTAYRWMIPDAVPFQKSFQFDFEHGNGSNSTDLEYRWVAFWYQKPVSSFEIADALTNGASGPGSAPAEGGAALESNAKLLVFVVLGFVAGVGALLISRKRRQ